MRTWNKVVWFTAPRATWWRKWKRSGACLIKLTGGATRARRSLVLISPLQGARRRTYSPSSHHLDGYERRELQGGRVGHVPVDLVRLAGELSFLEEHQLSDEKRSEVLKSFLLLLHLFLAPDSSNLDLVAD